MLNMGCYKKLFLMPHSRGQTTTLDKIIWIIGPHAHGIIGSTNTKSTYLVTNQLKELSLSQSVGGQSLSMSSTPTQSVDVHYVQSSTNLNGNQQPGGNKRKGCGNNHKGGRIIIIINPRTMLTMIDRTIMFEGKKEK
jgi:hypothetical protein